MDHNILNILFSNYLWFTTIYIYFQMKIINTKEMFKNLATYNCFYDCIIDIKY